MSRLSNKLRATSPGKLNLTFDILGDLPGGYHEVETLMQAVDIHDELVFNFEPADEFTVEITGIDFAGVKADVPTNQNNLIAKAALLFKTHAPVASGYKTSIHLHKAIPVAGGMGGGSGNAAATLVALNQWFNYPLTENEIKELAAQLGADVPFFIEGGTQIGTHRGDVLTKVNCRQELNFLIVGPKLFGMQTAEVYSAYDNASKGANDISSNSASDSASNSAYVNSSNKASASNSTYDSNCSSTNDSTRSSLNSRLSATECSALLQQPNSIRDAAQKFGNVFEPIVYAHRPELQFIQSRLTALGGLCTHLTGSGPTLYVCTESGAETKSIQQHLTDELMQGQNGWAEHSKLTLNMWVAKSVNHGVLISAD